MPILCILMETVKVIILDFLHIPTDDMFTATPKKCSLCFYIINEISHAIVYDIPQGRTLFAHGYSFTRLQYTYEAPLYGSYPCLRLYLKFITAVQSQNAPLLSGTADCCG